MIAKRFSGDTPRRRAFRFDFRCFFVLGRVLVSAAASVASGRQCGYAALSDLPPLVSRLSHIFMDTQLLIIAFLRIRTLDKLFEATIALVNFRICN